MSDRLHDVAVIGSRHPSGELREVAVYVDGKFYARGSVAEALAATRQNDRIYLAREVRYEIDQLGWGGRDERSLMFGQAVTLDDLRAIARR